MTPSTLIITLLLIALANIASATSQNLCVQIRPLFIYSDSAEFHRQLNDSLNAWSDAACVEQVAVDIPHAITIQHVINTVDRIEYEPFTHLFVSARPQTAVNVTKALAKLFDVPVVDNADKQNELLSQAAFKYSTEIPSIWQARVEPTKYQLVKRNISLHASTLNCAAKTLKPLIIPLLVKKNDATPSIASDFVRQFILFPNTKRVWASMGTNTEAEYYELAFAARAVAKYHRQHVLLLDMFNNLHVAPARNASNTSFLHTFSMPLKALFSTLGGDAFVISREGGVQNVKLSSDGTKFKALESAPHHLCLLEYFHHAPHHYLPYDGVGEVENDRKIESTLLAQSNAYEAMSTLLVILKRIHPELLLFCVSVLVPLLLIALPLLAILSVYALRLYGKLQSFSLDPF